MQRTKNSFDPLFDPLLLNTNMFLFSSRNSGFQPSALWVSSPACWDQSVEEVSSSSQIVVDYFLRPTVQMAKIHIFIRRSSGTVNGDGNSCLSGRKSSRS